MSPTSCYHNHHVFLSVSFYLCIIFSRVFSTRIVESKDFEKLHLHSYFESSVRPSQDSELVTIFAVKQRNLDKLEELLYDVSNPSSAKYGKHLTRPEVADLTANPISTKAVLDYLASHELTVLSQTIYGEYITVKATVGVWESILETKFSTYESTKNDKKKVVRASRYFMPTDIDDHVSAIFNVLDFPVPSKPMKEMSIPKGSARSKQAETYPGYITPDVLNSYYNIFSNVGNKLASQSVFSGAGQYFSSTDLSDFFMSYGLSTTASLYDPDSRDNDATCVADSNNCFESNMDLQYLMAIAQNIDTTIIYETDDTVDGFVSWITTTANMVNPPLVHSVSYAADEDQLYESIAYSFNTEAVKLGVMGVTILVASGDNGANGLGVNSDGTTCGYYAAFPASSPYVTAVGATMGAESGGPEVVCQSDVGGVFINGQGGYITSGGGFSTLSPAPAFQSSAISHYFSTVGAKPVSGYSSTGRGIPDVSLAGFSYMVKIGGVDYSLSGTSASTPVFAGMVSLVNAARLQAGKPALGWLNPAIYASGGSFTNDITSGNSKCTVRVCCTQGYDAAPGWDPVTGFGSVDFTKFYNYFINYSAKPSAAQTPTEKKAKVKAAKATKGPSKTATKTKAPEQPNEDKQRAKSTKTTKGKENPKASASASKSS